MPHFVLTDSVQIPSIFNPTSVLAIAARVRPNVEVKDPSAIAEMMNTAVAGLILSLKGDCSPAEDERWANDLANAFDVVIKKIGIPSFRTARRLGFDADSFKLMVDTMTMARGAALWYASPQSCPQRKALQPRKAKNQWVRLMADAYCAAYGLTRVPSPTSGEGRKSIALCPRFIAAGASEIARWVKADQERSKPAAREIPKDLAGALLETLKPNRLSRPSTVAELMRGRPSRAGAGSGKSKSRKH